MAINGNLKKLTPRQRRSIAALLSERDVKAAALAANVGARTLYRWLDDPLFRLALSYAEGEAIDAATRRLLAMNDPAISVLNWVLADKANPPAVRLRAAQTVVDYFLKLRELRSIEERLSNLENAVQSEKH
jgi:hypothetical protein